MKKTLSEIYSNFLLIFTGIIFLVTWPFILIGMFFHTLFKSKKSDATKLKILREISIIFIGISILLLLELIGDKFNL